MEVTNWVSGLAFKMIKTELYRAFIGKPNKSESHVIAGIGNQQYSPTLSMLANLLILRTAYSKYAKLK